MLNEAQLQKITKIFLKRVHRVDQWTYSTKTAQRACIDSAVLVREFQLLSELRGVTKSISLSDARECLNRLARQKEHRWRLSSDIDAWVQDKAREVKNMLRHVSAGIIRPSWHQAVCHITFLCSFSGIQLNTNIYAKTRSHDV
jgi:hypothetical protein